MLYARPIGLMLAIICCATVGKSAHSQPSRSHHITLRFEQVATDEGNVEYQLETFHTIFFADVDSAKLIAPDGTEFFWFGVHEARRNSFAELADLAFGDWMAIEQFDGQEISYPFRVQPFSLMDVFTDVPIITSPVSGSTVPSNFIVNWEFANGSMPSGRGLNIRASNLNILHVDHADDLSYSATIETLHRTPGPASIELYAHSGSHLPDPRFIDTPPELDGDSYRLRAYFESQSAPAFYQVVPEASSLVLAAIAFVAVLGRRRQFALSSSTFR